MISIYIYKVENPKGGITDQISQNKTEKEITPTEKKVQRKEMSSGEKLRTER